MLVFTWLWTLDFRLVGLDLGHYLKIVVLDLALDMGLVDLYFVGFDLGLDLGLVSLTWQLTWDFTWDLSSCIF